MEVGNKFEEWMILEIMGHNRYAGKVTEQAIGGASFVRIDVYHGDDEKACFTKIFGAGSIYAMTPVAEKVARLVATKLRNEPVQRWDLPEEWNNAPAICGTCEPETEEDEPEDDDGRFSY